MADPSQSQRPAPPGHVALPLLLALLALVAWSPSVLVGGFAFDDREAILENPVVRGELPVSAAFDRDYWFHRGAAGHYRPLATLSLRLDHSLFEDVAAGYHATNVLLHALVVLLLGLVLGRGLPRGLPWIGIALFAVHPVLADSVAWISGRTSMVSALGGLLGALLLLRSSSSSRSRLLAGFATCLGLLLALLGKEDGIVFAVAYWLLARDRRRAVLVGCTAGLALYFALRLHALGEFLPASPSAPLAGAPLWERLHVGGFSLLEALRLAVLPVKYAPHYRQVDLVPPLSPGTVVAAALAWLGLLLVLLAPLRGGRARLVTPSADDAASSSVRLSAALAALAFLPVLQLIPAGEVFAPRFLYPVLLFGSVALDGLLRALLPAARIRGSVLFVLITTCVALAWGRTRVYSSRASYRGAVLEQHPEDSRSWNGLGHARFEEGDVEAAQRAWRRALELDPTYSRPATNLGISHWQADEKQAAREYFEAAVRHGPENAIAHVWLGRARREAGEFEAAQALFERATRLAPGLAAAWNGLARARLDLGDLPGSREAAQHARELAPRDPATLETWTRIERAER